MAQNDNSYNYGNNGNQYSGERTQIRRGYGMPYQGQQYQGQQYVPNDATRTAYNQPQYQQPYRPQYQYPAPQPRKSNNSTVLWIIIGISAFVIGVAATILIMKAGDSGHEAETSTAPTAVEHTTAAPVQEQNTQPTESTSQIAVPYISQQDAVMNLTSEAVSGRFANTYNGITADAFRNLRNQGKLGHNRGSDFLRVKSGGITYSYVFKNGSVGDPGAKLTSVGADWHMADSYDADASCEQFDDYIMAQGGELAAGSYNSRSIYRLPNGFYVSAGHSGSKFIIYFYYDLFENSLYDNAAPRS